jgi:transposase
MRRHPTKRQFLTAAGAWNAKASLVEHPLFVQSDFFDPRDKVQVKYEMLRAHAVDEVAVSAASQQFGYSRDSFYTAMEALLSEGVTGLADGKRGPKEPHKLTPEVQAFIHRQIERTPDISSQDLAERIEAERGVQVHRRSVERFRQKERTKKKASRRRRRR